jgi:sugar phosphate isomerase/epimerase
MKILILSNPYENLLNQIELAKSLKFDGIEIVLERETKKLFLENKNKISKELGNLIYVYHLDHRYNIFNEAHFKELEKICKEIDSFAVLHLNCEKENFEDFVKKVKKLNNEKIIIENLDHSIEELQYFLEISDLNLAFDFSHAISFNSTKKVLNFVEKNKERMVHFHISDCISFEHSHLPLGKGILPIKEIWKILKNFSKTITLEIIETNIPEIEYFVSLNILKSL